MAITTLWSGDSHGEMAISKGKENTTPRQCWQTKVILSIGHWLQCLGQRQGTWKQCLGKKKRHLIKVQQSQKMKNCQKMGIRLGAVHITLPFCCSFENRIWKLCQETESRIQGQVSHTSY